MPKPIYDWKRFWCRREGRFSLMDDGFLVDPGSELATYYPSDAVAFDSISDKPCLVLLGEPGSGKSTALERECAAVKNALLGTGHDTLWVDLREYSTDQRLSQKVFASPKIQEWCRGTYNLHAFFDSLDESLLRIDNISDVLRSEIRDLPAERMRVRIACRTADWPPAWKQPSETCGARPMSVSSSWCPFERSTWWKLRDHREFSRSPFSRPLPISTLRLLQISRLRSDSSWMPTIKGNPCPRAERRFTRRDAGVSATNPVRVGETPRWGGAN